MNKSEIKNIIVVTNKGDVITYSPREISEIVLNELCGNNNSTKIDLSNIFNIGEQYNASAKIQQILAVFIGMLQNNYSFQESVRRVAEIRGVAYASIADKCTRKIGCTAEEISMKMKMSMNQKSKLEEFEVFLEKTSTEDDKKFIRKVFEELYKKVQ